MNDDLFLFFNITDMTRALWEGGRVDIGIKGFKENNPVEKNLTISLKEIIFNPTLDVLKSLPIKSLVPDYYEIELNLIDEMGERVDTKKLSFAVSPQVQINHPISLFKTFPLTNSYIFYYTLAYQYDKARDFEEAESHFEKAYGLNPSYMRGITGYAHFMLKVRKFERALELIEKVKDVDELRFDYFSIRGKAFMGMGNYAEAITDFIEGNKIYNSDTSLLNSLGFCFYQVGDKEEALRALNASLSLNPEQDDIVELKERIEKDNR
jgi:tetratricopeptide (TPR) repeat protein